MIDSRTLLGLYDSDTHVSLEAYSSMLRMFESNPNRFALRVLQYSAKDLVRRPTTEVPREKLASTALEFHLHAGTLTEGVRQALETVERESIIVRLAHQPNIFPYLGVVGQFPLMKFISDLISQRHNRQNVLVYLIVNYDVGEDNRFRTVHFPDSSRKRGVFNISGTIPSGFLNKPMYAIPRPSKNQIQDWIGKIETTISTELSFLRRNGIREKSPNNLFGRLGEISDDVWSSYAKADSLSDFNSVFLSKLVNIRLGLPVLFVRGNRLHRWYEGTWRFFIENRQRLASAEESAIKGISSAGIAIKYRNTPRIFPFWYFCDTCDDRVELTMEGREILGKCPGCKREYCFSAMDREDLASQASRLAPRVLMDDISDVLALNPSGGVSYIGSAEHVIISNEICRKIGIQVFPQIVWQPKMEPYGVSDVSASLHLDSAQNHEGRGREELVKEVAVGRVSILYYLINAGFLGFEESWENFLRKHKSVGIINRDQRLSPLAIERKHIRAVDANLSRVLSVTPIRTPRTIAQDPDSHE